VEDEDDDELGDLGDDDDDDLDIDDELDDSDEDVKLGKRKNPAAHGGDEVNKK